MITEPVLEVEPLNIDSYDGGGLIEGQKENCENAILMTIDDEVHELVDELEEVDVAEDESGEPEEDDVSAEKSREQEEIHYSTPDGKKHIVKKSGSVDPPTVGMTFDMWEEIDVYFRKYAKQEGFGITRGSSAYRQRNGKPTIERMSVRWECEYFGAKDERVCVDGQKVNPKLHAVTRKGVKFATRNSKKCGCPVHIYASAERDTGTWVIRKAVLVHEGHLPTPKQARHVSSYRQESVHGGVRKRLFSGVEAGMKIPAIHRALALERHGLENTPFTERDLRNIVAKEKRLRLQW